MSESTRSASPEVAATGPARPSVRELLAELATLEDATRGLGWHRRPSWSAQSTNLLAALSREQEIIDELHRRCPKAPLTTGSPTADDEGARAQAD